MQDVPMVASPQLPQPPRTGGISDEEVCRYIAEMCVELRHMARRPRLRLIAYLLDMARIEAEKVVNEASRERR